MQSVDLHGKVCNKKVDALYIFESSDFYQAFTKLLPIPRKKTFTLCSIFFSVKTISIWDKEQVNAKSTYKNSNLVSYKLYYYSLKIYHAMFLSAYIFCTKCWMIRSCDISKMVILLPSITSLRCYFNLCDIAPVLS